MCIRDSFIDLEEPAETENYAPMMEDNFSDSTSVDSNEEVLQRLFEERMDLFDATLPQLPPAQDIELPLGHPKVNHMYRHCETGEYVIVTSVSDDLVHWRVDAGHHQRQHGQGLALELEYDPLLPHNKIQRDRVQWEPGMDQRVVILQTEKPNWPHGLMY